jgi:hypothetical protein
VLPHTQDLIRISARCVALARVQPRRNKLARRGKLLFVLFVMQKSALAMMLRADRFDQVR